MKSPPHPPGNRLPRPGCYLAYGLSFAAIITMAVDVVLAIRLRKPIVGGDVGKKWGLLTSLVVFFFFGYLLSPLVLLLNLPIEYMSVLVFAVFLFGAVFVWVVIGIVRDTLSFLDLLKED